MSTCGIGILPMRHWLEANATKLRHALQGHPEVAAATEGSRIDAVDVLRE